MKNVKFQQAAQKTEGQAGGLHQKAVQRAAEKGSPPTHLFPLATLICSPLDCPVVQPAGPHFLQLASPWKIRIFHLPTRPSVECYPG